MLLFYRLEPRTVRNGNKQCRGLQRGRLWRHSDLRSGRIRFESDLYRIRKADRNCIEAVSGSKQSDSGGSSNGDVSELLLPWLVSVRIERCEWGR